MKDERQKEIVQERISAFEPQVFILGLLLSALSALICMQIIAKVGVTPNTSIIGAVVAMVLARIPLASMRKFRSLERQNLIQTTVSAGGFAAANCGLLAVGIVYLMGKPEYVWPIAIGSLFGVVISIFVVGLIFDSSVYPASAAWPPGVATARAIEAGDEGGAKGLRLLQGVCAGALAAYFKLPAAGIGIVFIANIFSMAALGVGLLVRGYVPLFTGFNIGSSPIPNGIMVGAGLTALVQSVAVIIRDSKKRGKIKFPEAGNASNITVTTQGFKKAVSLGFGLYLAGAVAVALISGIFSQMSLFSCVFWILYAAISCTAAMLLVGMAAMHSGWFPGFAITTIFMTIGIFLGFPPIALALLTGYVTSCGPCFADMGYDLKTGWILRGCGRDREYELYGRKQQIIIEEIGGVVGILVVLLTLNMFFQQDLFAPVSRTFANTINGASDMNYLLQLMLWSIPGIVIQLTFGPTRMVGVLFATGLLINNPIYGVGVLAAVVVRLIFGTKFMEGRDAGLIAGDGLFGFFSALVRMYF